MNELKQKANEFYGKEIWNNSQPVKVYMDYREDFTLTPTKFYIGQYTRNTEQADFFLDVVRRLREITREYSIPTSMRNLTIDWSEE